MKTSLSLDLSISVNTVLSHAWSKQEIDSQIFGILKRDISMRSNRWHRLDIPE